VWIAPGVACVSRAVHRVRGVELGDPVPDIHPVSDDGCRGDRQSQWVISHRCRQRRRFRRGCASEVCQTSSHRVYLGAEERLSLVRSELVRTKQVTVAGHAVVDPDGGDQHPPVRVPPGRNHPGLDQPGGVGVVHHDQPPPPAGGQHADQCTGLPLHTIGNGPRDLDAEVRHAVNRLGERLPDRLRTSGVHPDQQVGPVVVLMGDGLLHDPSCRVGLSYTRAATQPHAPVTARACLPTCSVVGGQAGRVSRTRVLSDAQWARIEPLMGSSDIWWGVRRAG